MEVEDSSENCSKRVKLRDLESVLGTENRRISFEKTLKRNDFDVAQAGREGSNTVHQDDNSDSRKLGRNVVNLVDDDTVACIEKFVEPCDYGKKKMEFEDCCNADDVSSSINGTYYPHKDYKNVKSTDELDSGSSLGPLDGKDSLRVWNGLKQNNYMSTPHGGMPMPAPKPRGKKKNKNDDALKKKMERAKKEQVDRFARFAAPSGLLNGLNPGIINHVRNTKQVQSIIESLVNENRNSGSKQASNIKRGTLEINEGNKGDGDLYIGETTDFSRMTSRVYMENENAGLQLKPSNLTGALENPSCLPNEKSANHTTADSLSIKAANVASQWLELLCQDIKGRLAALKRSKKRVQSVITTELPFLVSSELSSNVDKALVDLHSVRWRTIYEQMEKTLSEEETRLESWLHQVKEMQLHCESGLQQSRLHASEQMRSIGSGSRPVDEVDGSERDLAVKAAAASIYSTSNFLLSMENNPCC